MSYMELAVQVSGIARQAGAAIMEIYGYDDFEVENKSDESPLTLADRTANRIICDELRQLETVYPIISEENKEIPYEERRYYEFCWLVDPLDGTKEFLKRNDEFTVNIALIHQGRPILGVVFLPALGELYWAVERAGAFQVRGEDVEKLRSSSFRLSDPGLKIVSSRSHLNEETQAFINRFQEPELVSRGSALKFIMLAKGEAQIYPRLAPTMEWDTGAAQIILEEAGGKVLVAGTDEPLSYNKESLRNPSFVAYGKVEE